MYVCVCVCVYVLDSLIDFEEQKPNNSFKNVNCRNSGDLFIVVTG